MLWMMEHSLVYRYILFERFYGNYDCYGDGDEHN